ncbi:unnamed protein product [Closterium sp. Naga37s-1]|nr:unnamed protein product [Closterium sp. Naga37s-1]
MAAGSAFVSASKDRTLRLWQVGASPPPLLWQVGASPPPLLWQVGASPPPLLWQLAADNTQASTGPPSLRASVVAVMRGHSAAVQCVAVNARANKLASGSWDSSIKLWTLPKLGSIAGGRERGEDGSAGGDGSGGMGAEAGGEGEEEGGEVGGAEGVGQARKRVRTAAGAVEAEGLEPPTRVGPSPTPAPAPNSRRPLTHPCSSPQLASAPHPPLLQPPTRVGPSPTPAPAPNSRRPLTHPCSSPQLESVHYLLLSAPQVAPPLPSSPKSVPQLSLFQPAPQCAEVSGVWECANVSGVWECAEVSGVWECAEVSGVWECAEVSGVWECAEVSGVWECAEVSGVWEYAEVSGVWECAEVSGVWECAEVSGVWECAEVSGVWECAEVSGVWECAEVSGVWECAEVSGVWECAEPLHTLSPCLPVTPPLPSPFQSPPASLPPSVCPPANPLTCTAPHRTAPPPGWTLLQVERQGLPVQTRGPCLPTSDTSLLPSNPLPPTTRLDFIAQVERQDVPVQTLGPNLPASDPGHASPAEVQRRLCDHRFALLFEELAPLHVMSPHFWAALACGTVPLVVAKGSIALFSPADNVFLQVLHLPPESQSVSDLLARFNSVRRGDEVRQVGEWAGYLQQSQRTYSDMTRWKADVPSDAFLALLDLSIVPSHCRLCIHLATKQLVAWDESSTRKVCRCWEEGTNTTLYHLYVRERGTFAFHSLFLKSSELTMAHLVRAIYHLYHRLGYRPLWHGHRPDALSTGGAAAVRVLRVYPVESSQEMVLHGSGAFRRDRQLQDFVEATPCPRLEVILV